MGRMERTAAALLTAALVAALLAGCSGRRGRGGRPMVSRDASLGMDAGPLADGGAGTDGGADAGSTEPIRGCFQTCTTVDDCASPTVPTNDADNWACSSGVCDYLGCNSDAECSDTFDGDYRCLPVPGGSTNGCYQACATVDDCASPTVPTNDADNWACSSGVCDYLGCNSDSECSDTFDGDYRCLPTPDGSTTGCYQACATVDDCASPTVPTNDADNWACTSGVCDYLGCNSDMECSDTFDGTYTCRAP